MKRRVLLTTLTVMALAVLAFGGDDGPVVGVLTWEPSIRPDATSWDKTDYWAAIALSPSTGKYGSSCEWMARENAERDAREKCNAPDARAVVVCCNGWCALALGGQTPGKDFCWGVGWGPSCEVAEQHALEGARERAGDARVVYSIDSRQMRTGGAIAYSESTGNWGYSTGGGRSAPYQAIQNCKAADAKVIVQKADCWLAFALGDDKSAYGWGSAGNRADAESNALEACRQRTTNAKVVFSFCTNGVTH